MQCYKCLAAHEMEGKPLRSETCGCGAYFRCCRNCRFYDPVAYNECREPQAERVTDKEMANFCEYFEVASVTKSAESARKEEARKKLNELFKKK